MNFFRLKKEKMVDNNKEIKESRGNPNQAISSTGKTQKLLEDITDNIKDLKLDSTGKDSSASRLG